MHPLRTTRRSGSREPRLAVLRIILILAASALIAGCATESSGRPGESAPPAPDLPAAELGADRLQPALRYPRLLDDPEEMPGMGVAPATAESNPGVVTDPLIEDLLASLTLRQRIGQRFISRVQGTRITHGAGRSIVEVSPAGFIIYPWNFTTADDVRRLTASLQDLARAVTPGIDLLLCADQEGGRVATFRFDDSVRVPSAHTMGGLGPAAIEAGAYLTGLHMKDLGLNMNLAPVLDVYGIDDRTIIGDRSYSGDPDEVAGFVGPYLRGARKAGIISVAKHFPGHGISTVDSHASLPVVDATLDQVRASDLVPFAAAIDEGVQVIMTAHILYESIDPYYPVTLSRIFLTDLLRRELKFQGVVMSDGLEMGAIRDNFNLTEALVRMFKYDVDLMLLFVSYDIVTVVDQVEELIRRGRITEEDVDRGARRVLRLKLENGLANPEAL